MENTGNIDQAVASPADQSTAESSTSSPKSGRRSTVAVSLADRLAILQSAANALIPYGIEVGAQQFFSDGRRIVGIYLAGDVELVGGRIVPTKEAA